MDLDRGEGGSGRRGERGKCKQDVRYERRHTKLEKKSANKLDMAANAFHSGIRRDRTGRSL